MNLPDGCGLSVLVYSAPPGTAAEDGLKLLASWSATSGEDQEADAPGDLSPPPAVTGTVQWLVRRWSVRTDGSLTRVVR